MPTYCNCKRAPQKLQCDHDHSNGTQFFHVLADMTARPDRSLIQYQLLDSIELRRKLADSSSSMRVWNTQLPERHKSLGFEVYLWLHVFSHSVIPHYVDMKLYARFVPLLAAAVSLATRPSTAFVKTDGQCFTLNGAPYTVFGSNSYWVGLTGLTTNEMNVTFQNIAATGATTVRTWGFNEVTTASGDYYQLWNGSTPTINYGPTGLKNFGQAISYSCVAQVPHVILQDNVVATAKANNIRLIVTLTNNWNNYGGMDVYVDQILGQGQPHDYFYTDPTVITAYKKYVEVWIERYIDEPTIFGWELAFNNQQIDLSGSATSGTCTTTTITNWVKTMSAYIKSLDCNHLVGLGDEGWFNWTNNIDASYDGSQGIDFDVNLAIDTIDFGTFHLYPVRSPLSRELTAIDLILNVQYSWDEETPR
ncbi:glycoside hydrolase superfamily [Boletus reticuloceps]|uniref:mannan endo-1,4-beta-mannosidase n=1 Tax=Boletus reticuloceps TaxID=495285 RepID=A0A8I2YM14_9AGAM|nr:glycoside hydrolase superfamily [Boletus reticuloceps]